jgi:CO/xanthine dehydrogenase Mo-binding subunit
MAHDLAHTRRAFLTGGGSLVMSFSMLGRGLAQEGPGPQASKGGGDVKAPLPGSLKQYPMLDAWIKIDADGSMTVMTGKCELGQGAKTALLQIAAEQLRVDMGALRLITADTRHTPNEGFTAGSHTMQDSGTAILNAAAQVREKLIDIAAGKLSAPRDQLKAENAAVTGPDGKRATYADLVTGLDLHVEAQPNSVFGDHGAYRYMGKPVQRVDIPAKVTGGEAYLQDMRMDGMVHARVVRPPGYGATMQDIDVSSVEKMPGVLKVVRDGSYLAVIATKEYQAVKAQSALQALAKWQEKETLPQESEIFDRLAAAQPKDRVAMERHGAPAPASAKRFDIEFRRDYQQHGSIGPSCGVALMKDGRLTVWSHAQGMFPLRMAIAQMCRMPTESVDCIHVEGSGCYGHNGADDAAADAALLARAFPDRPVRVQYMREDENIWEPKGSAMLVRASAALDDSGSIVDWDYQVWSNTHSTRPPGAGQLMPAWSLAQPFEPETAKPVPLPEGDGDRNSQPLYAFPNVRAVYHYIEDAPVRVSAMRGLGAYMNVFSIESFMDDLALAAKADPVEFRIKHLQDARAQDVIRRAAQEFGWDKWTPRPHVGRGFAFARYKNLGAYAAVAIELSVDPETGNVKLHRAEAAVDSGEAVNPDGIRNQIEGGIIQSASWTLYERVAFNRSRILSRDWSTYPIMRFRNLPDTVRIHVIDRPGQPFLGTGEATQGPTAAAIGNAIRDATGRRFTHIPIKAQDIRAGLEA